MHGSKRADGDGELVERRDRIVVTRRDQLDRVLQLVHRPLRRELIELTDELTRVLRRQREWFGRPRASTVASERLGDRDPQWNRDGVRARGR